MNKFTKVLVTSSWDYKDDQSVQRTLDDMVAHYGRLLLINDNGAGAAGIANNWAGHNRLPKCTVPGLWGFKTDPDRRVQVEAMLALVPDLCVVFGPDERGVGMAAKLAHIPVYEIA